MKAMETGAPVVSVPAGILKEFMSPVTTPPPVTTVGNSTITSKSSSQALTVTANSISYASILPSSIDTSAVSITPATSVHPSHTNGQVLKDKVIDIEGKEADLNYTENDTVSAKDDKIGNPGEIESLVNGNTTGVKRESEEDGGSRKPDLKKIRVFAPSGEDATKRDFSVTVQEFNQHLDNASKRLEEAEKLDNKDLETLNELRSCFNNPPKGIGIMSGLSSGSLSGKSSGSQDGKSSEPSIEKLNGPSSSRTLSGASNSVSSGPSGSVSSGPSSGPSSGVSSGPSSGVSSGPSSGVSSGPSSGMSSGPSSGMSTGPSSGMSSGSSSGISSGSSSGISSGPSSGMSSGSSSGMSIGPSSGLPSGSSNGMSNGPSNGISSGVSIGSSTGVSSGSYNGISSSSPSGISSGSSSGTSSGSSSGTSSGSSSGMSSGPSSGVSGGPSSGVSSGLSSRSSSGILSRNGNSSDVNNSHSLTKALVNVVQSKEVEIVPLAPESREMVMTVSREREGVNINNIKDKVISKGDKENKQMKRRMRKLSRKDLEKLILQLFCEKTLYQSEHGKMKQLCEKLESTLESNRKKTAQFHKEIEDLRKVTSRLSAEHAARKGQYVAPIRIKRSVGIQAAPHIINKGIMNAAIKTIAPRMSPQGGVSRISYPVKPSKVESDEYPPSQFKYQNKVIPSTSTSQSLITTGALGILATSQPGAGRPQTVGAAGLSTMASAQGLGTVRAAPGQMLMMAPTGSVQTISRASNSGAASTTTTVLPVAQGRVVRAPIGGMNSILSPAGTLLSPQRPLLLQNDKAVAGTTAGLQTSLTSRGSGVIDLTDEDEGGRGSAGRPQAVVPKPGTLVKVPASGTAQLLPLQQTGGVGQVVLLPNTSGGQPTTALIVSQVSTAMQTLDSVTNPAVAQSRIGSHGSHTTNNSRVMASVVNTATRTTSSAISQVNQLRHPAPLPRTPFQQVAGLTKKLPPQPTLKLSHKDSSIVLSWTMSKTEDHETIASYQLYAYQEGAAPPCPSLWKKVGSVKALELPMACTLTQFMPGHVYHFAVRAVDTKSRLGPFSEPRSIKLDKKLVSLSESL